MKKISDYNLSKLSKKELIELIKYLDNMLNISLDQMKAKNE